MVSANSYTLGSVLQEGEKPFNEEVWNTTEKFLEQEIMVDKVKFVMKSTKNALNAPPWSNVVCQA